MDPEQKPHSQEAPASTTATAVEQLQQESATSEKAESISPETSEQTASESTACDRPTSGDTATKETRDRDPWSWDSFAADGEDDDTSQSTDLAVTRDTGAGDPFDDDESWCDTSVAPDVVDRLNSTHATSNTNTADGQNTSPTNTASIERIWGESLDRLTPTMRLKKPDEPRRTEDEPISPEVDPPDRIHIAGYELLSVLGEGGVGVVYKGIQKSFNRKIAVKMVKQGSQQSKKQHRKFVTEAMVTGELDHPNIVPVHDLGTTEDGRPFYVMKMVKGRPWSTLIRKNSLAENLRILLDVCDAIGFAHSRGIIHRDLKPENVMLGEFGEVQVMDWGLGMPVSTDGIAVVDTGHQAAGGTPAYMAPEMATGEEAPLSIRSDIYLLGAILYEIVSGRPPHGGKRVLDCLQNVVSNVIEPTEATGVLKDIALLAMQTRPEDRYESVRDFKDAIVQYQANAESINISQRALEDLNRAQRDQDYDAFNEALYGFREALKLWDENDQARAGMREARLAFARCAFAKGDLDLAESTLDPEIAEHQSLAQDIRQAQHRRDVTKRRFRLLKVAAVGLVVTVIGTLTVSSVWISRAKNRAITARQSEAQQRRKAEQAMAKALQQEQVAVQALADAKTSFEAMLEAQKQEAAAMQKAHEAELATIATRDQLARSGMLLDNSWWVFDEAQAKQRQADAAEAINQPAQLTIDLSNGQSVNLALIPAGEFVMGSPPKEDNRAAVEHLHRVRHTQSYYLSTIELTEAQWFAITGQVPESAKAAQRKPSDKLPVSAISLEQIKTLLLPALQQYAPQGYVFRLPTEAEWEYACRAGTATAYYTGDSVDALRLAGWFADDSGESVKAVKPVGQKQPNAFGLYDMHGNVSEVCRDEYDPEFYLESPTEDPIASAQGNHPVIRGGGILNLPEHCRSAYRSYFYSKNKYQFVGVRLALAPASDR